MVARRKLPGCVEIRREWLARTVDQVQVEALTTSDIEDVASRIERPRTRIEERLLRGLLAELAQSRARHDRPLKVVRIEPPPKRGAERANAARALIDTDFSKLKSLSHVADALGCHPVHLERVFRATYGVSLGRYLRFVRTRESLALLADRTLKIMVLPMLVGFNGRASFYRAVREFTGLTPCECRMRGMFSLPSILSGASSEVSSE